MALQVATKDAAALTDADLDEMASMEGAFIAGQLSKAKEDWVLITTARFDGKLHGFTFSTLERIGGTPCVLIGLMSVKRTSKRDQVLRGLMGEAYHRALMAFPDEDVVVGSRFVSADALEAFKELARSPRARHQRRRRGARLGSATRQAVRRRRQVRRAVVHCRHRQSGLPRPRVLEAGEARSRRRRDVRCRAGRQGRRHGRLRLDDGRRPRQAREALNTAPTAMT